MKVLPLFSLFCFFAMSLYAGDELPEKTGDVLLNRLQLAQRLQQNLDAELKQDGLDPIVGGKSVAYSVMMSTLIPGAGQFYAKSYWKSALFLAVETTSWVVFASYSKKGKDKDTELKSFADENWSEYRHWSYVNYLGQQVLEDYEGYAYEEVDGPNGGKFFLINEDFYNANQEQLENEMRELENRLPTSYGFTHDLPETKTQQYYEMIGKYPEQFGNSWSDANFDSRYSGYLDGVITSFNQTYTLLRDDSNRLYDVAGYGSMVVLINHLVSAIDAGFTTRGYNNQISLSYRNDLQYDNYVNLFGLSIDF